MKIHKNALIERAASTDKTRIGISQPYLDCSNCFPRLVATNGRMLVSIPVEATKEESGYVPAAVLKEARKVAVKKAQAVSLERVPGNELVSALKLENGASLPVKNEGNFPNWRQVIPSDDRPVLARIALNPELLMAIAEAMDSGAGVVLEIEHDRAPIVVRPYISAKPALPIVRGAPHPLADAKGVLMPIRMD